MSSQEYNHGGELLEINYDFAESPFGQLIVAATKKGICYMAFFEGENERALSELKSNYPAATYHQFLDSKQQNALFVFTQEWKKLKPISLHVKGTAFQLRVWHELLEIPLGELSTYGRIALQMKNSRASRAVGSAVAGNPVAFLIPCHRVVRSSGKYGEYRWGRARKNEIIKWEANKSLKTDKSNYNEKHN